MSFFSSSSSTSIGPKTKLQKQLEKDIGTTSTQQLGLYKDLVGQAKEGGGYLDQLLQQMTQQQSAFNEGYSPDQQGQAEAQFRNNVMGLGGAEDQALQSILQMIGQGPNATEEQLGRIRGSADLAVQTGLSDLGRFRDQTFDAIRQNSAARGLRPDDTPILNEFTKSGEEFGRQAEQLVNQIRGQQMQSELQYPFQNIQAGLSLGQGASDLAARRRQFEAGLAETANQNRLNFGQSLQNNQLGVLGALQPQSQLGTLVQQRLGQSTTTNNPSGFQQLQQIGQLASSAAGPLAMLSDKRAKKEIEDLDSDEILSKLRGSKYRYKDERNGEGERLGIMAQDLKRAGMGFAVKKGDDGFLRVNTNELVLPLLGLAADLNKRLKKVEE